MWFETSYQVGELVLGPFERSYCAGQDQPLPVTCPGLPGRRYKAICSWLFPGRCMGEAMLEINASHYQYEAWKSSPKGPGHPEACHHLTAIHKAKLLKEPQVVMGVECCGVSGDEWSGVLWVNAYSNLMTVMSLGPLYERLRAPWLRPVKPQELSNKDSNTSLHWLLIGHQNSFWQCMSWVG